MKKDRMGKTVAIDPSVHEKVSAQAKKQHKPLHVYVTELLSFAADRAELTETKFPFIEKMAEHDGRLVLWDSKVNREAAVRIKNMKMYCELDDSVDCIHIQYVESYGKLGKLFKPR